MSLSAQLSMHNFNTRELSVKRKVLRAPTLVGLKRGNPALDPLAVLHLDNHVKLSKNESALCIFPLFKISKIEVQKQGHPK